MPLVTSTPFFQIQSPAINSYQQIWFKADAGVSTSGPNVTGWANQAATGATYDAIVDAASSGVSPQFVSSDTHGKPSLDFLGTTQANLRTTNDVGLFLENVWAHIFMVIKDDTSIPASLSEVYYESKIGDSSRYFRIQHFDGTGDLSAILSTSSTVTLTSNPAPTNVWYLVEVERVVQDFYLRVNGTQVDSQLSTGLSGTDTSDQTTMGRRGVSLYGLPWGGRISEVIGYASNISGTAVLTAQERSDTQAYLISKYGL